MKRVVSESGTRQRNECTQRQNYDDLFHILRLCGIFLPGIKLSKLIINGAFFFWPRQGGVGIVQARRVRPRTYPQSSPWQSGP